jgi:hypothetical protein
MESKQKCLVEGISVITVTQQAKEVLKTILIASGADPDEGLRLLPAVNGEFVLTLGKELSGDQVVEFDERKVLLVGIEYFHTFNGTTLDCRDIEDGTILFIR